MTQIFLLDTTPMTIMVALTEPIGPPRAGRGWKIVFNDPAYSQLIREIPIGIEAVQYIGILVKTPIPNRPARVALVECEVFITGKSEYLKPLG